MDVRCEQCQTEYEFEATRVRASGVTVKCTACGFVFRMAGSIPPRSASTGHRHEWLVRKTTGQNIAFSDVFSLQKWIVEGRLERDDAVSKDGIAWKVLGNIPELEAFFSVVEPARAFNELLMRAPVRKEKTEQISGTDILAPRAVAASTRVESVHESASDALALADNQALTPVESGRTARRTARHRAHLPLRSTGSLLGFEGLEFGSALPSKSSGPTRPETPTPQEASHIAGFNDPQPNSSQAREAAFMDAAWGTQPNPPATSPWQKRKPRRMRDGLVLLGAGLLAGAFAAWFGVIRNVVSSDGENVSRPSISESQESLVASDVRQHDADVRLERIRRNVDLDTEDSLELATLEMEQALFRRPTDPVLLSEFALILTARSDRLRKSAATSDGVVGEATRKTETASHLMKRAFVAARRAFSAEPNSLTASRALADYYRVQHDASGRFEEMLARAKAAAEALGTTDAQTLFMEAASMIDNGLSDLSATHVDRAENLLRQAITARPTLTRAHVLLSRLLLQTGRGEAAIAAARHAATISPGHAEPSQIVAEAQAKKMEASDSFVGPPDDH